MILRRIPVVLTYFFFLLLVKPMCVIHRDEREHRDNAPSEKP